MKMRDKKIVQRKMVPMGGGYYKMVSTTKNVRQYKMTDDSDWEDIVEEAAVTVELDDDGDKAA